MSANRKNGPKTFIFGPFSVCPFYLFLFATKSIFGPISAFGDNGRWRGRCPVCLEHLLLADCGNKFLEIEWLEVGDVLEVCGTEGGHCGLEHC